jgi:hypothetical protein
VTPPQDEESHLRYLRFRSVRPALAPDSYVRNLKAFLAAIVPKRTRDSSLSVQDRVSQGWPGDHDRYFKLEVLSEGASESGPSDTSMLAGGLVMARRPRPDGNEEAVYRDEGGEEDPLQEALNSVLHRVYCTSSLQVVVQFCKSEGE